MRVLSAGAALPPNRIDSPDDYLIGTSRLDL